MKRKIVVPAIACFVIFALLMPMISFCVGSERGPSRYYVCGEVLDSYDDNKVEIYNDTIVDWVCKNITVYSVDGEKPPEVDNASTDKGKNHPEYDTFLFDEDGGFSWRMDDVGREGICVGEAVKDQVNYTFITNFTYKENARLCGPTEWEPIPDPIIYLKGDTWVNLSIPKFKNPQVSKLEEGGGTPNKNNTIGFAVYRGGEHIGNTTSCSANYYYFNDTISIGNVYYSVAPICRGDYTTYGRSQEVSSDIPPRGEAKFSFVSPTAATSWTGDTEHDIKYTISGGLEPYTIELSYGTPLYSQDNIFAREKHDAVGTYSYKWEVPKIDTEKACLYANITDDSGITKGYGSSWLKIDSSTPQVITKSIQPIGRKVSIYDKIIIEFNEPMDQTSVEQTFSIAPSAGELSWDWKTRNKTIISHAPFEPNTTYTCNISTLVKDVSEPGNNLANYYSWQFTTTPSISVSLHFPDPDAILTGGTTQNIVYEVGYGNPLYRIVIMFSENGSAWETIATLEGVRKGLHNCSWNIPVLNTTTAQLKLNVTDIKAVSVEKQFPYFNIDSTPPTIVTYSGSEGILRTEANISITFSESMNKQSVVGGFSLKDSEGNLINIMLVGWKDEKTVIFKPATDLTPNMNYTAGFGETTAKDNSTTGNYLKSYFWDFTAVAGKGLIIISVDFPSVAKKGDTGTIKVTAENVGPWGYSGRLKVKFEQSEDGVTWAVIDTKYISNLKNGTSGEVSVNVSFDRYGSYYFLVTVTSDAPTDLLDGKSRVVTSASLTVTEERGLGPVPYALIALLVLIVIVIAFLVLAGKKKGAVKEEKPPEEEEK